MELMGALCGLTDRTRLTFASVTRPEIDEGRYFSTQAGEGGTGLEERSIVCLSFWRRDTPDGLARSIAGLRCPGGRMPASGMVSARAVPT